ncbi:MAG: glycoside hydrolase family 3 C-terminal domain-containing protein [Oscillospiraceae bacterium]|jgi:beta-glucosidase|nr:glycoside hydrolase family 3 C-terminal domain-containing protein [Oscillospiraceae bacterium]
MSKNIAPSFMHWGNILIVNHPWITPENISRGGLEVRFTIDAALPESEWLTATAANSPFGASATYEQPLPPYFKLKAYVKFGGERSEYGYLEEYPQQPSANISPGAYLPHDLPKSVTITPPRGAVIEQLGAPMVRSVKPLELRVTYGVVPYVKGTFKLTEDALAGIPDPTDGEPYAVPIAVTGADDEHAFVIKAAAIGRSAEKAFVSPVLTLFYVPDNSVAKLNPENIEETIAAMTVEEKVAFTGGIGGDPTNYINDGPAGATYAIPRLGIPGLILADGPAGVRMRKNATVWLSPTGMASTWNLPLIEEVGQRVAAEAKHFAVDVILAPGLNIQRNPLGGRNFEYYSEDPYVTGLVGAAYVRGVQSGDVGTSPKHFAGNDQENHRGQGNVVTSERALREIYLRGFEIVSKENPWTYMVAYNAINGTLANANTWLLTETLRELWGWDGLVMSDWGADYDAVKSLIAKMDLGEPTRNSQPVLEWLADSSASAEELTKRAELLNSAVRNMLKLVLKSNAYNGAYGKYHADGTYGKTGLTKSIINDRSLYFGGSRLQLKSAEVNHRLAAEGFVLLKNDAKALPLGEQAKLSLVTSEIAYDELENPGWYNCTASLGDIVTQGRGSAQVKFNADGGVSYAPTLREGLQANGFKVVEWKRDGELAGTSHLPHGQALGEDEGANIAAKASDVTAAAKRALELGADAFVFVMTRISGEGQDVIPAEFELCERERSVFAPYADTFRAAGKKVIVLLNCGSAVETSLFREKADAILDVYNPGTEGANAIADILSGRVSPSGKLTQSFPLTYNDSPSVSSASEGHSGLTFGTNPVYYDEGVFVGYRYFDTFGEQSRLAYPFGFGLSYTSFEFSDLTFDKAALTAAVKITNVGDSSGKEVVQLYLGASTYKAEGRPRRELKAFAKTKLLAPGESEVVTLTLTPRDLQYYDDGGKQLAESVEQYTDGKQWKTAPGTVFTVTVGNTSDAETLAKSGVSTEFTV